MCRERGHDDNLVIDTGPVKISTFSPTETYITQLMREPSLVEYTLLPYVELCTSLRVSWWPTVLRSRYRKVRLLHLGQELSSKVMASEFLSKLGLNLSVKRVLLEDIHGK